MTLRTTKSQDAKELARSRRPYHYGKLLGLLSPLQLSIYRATGEIGYITSQSIAVWTGTKIGSVRDILYQLTEIGLLKRERQGKEFVYRRTGVKL